MFDRLLNATHAMQKTNIQQFFSDKTIFVTGGTGFIGSLLIEKLLRECKDVKRIYVLVRERQNQNCEKQFDKLKSSFIFRSTDPEALKKLILVKGNLEYPELGLSSADLEILIEQVNCIFHVGATVKLVEPLQRALRCNVFGTNEVINLAKKTKNLQALVYVSTMYSHCVNNEVKEEVARYDDVNSEDILKLTADSVIAETVNQSKFLSRHPNTYTCSKFLAEDLIMRTARGLPVAIVRPSMVLSTWKEPVVGWMHSYHPLSVFTLGFNLGMLHVLASNPAELVDFVPADYVINHLIAVAWNLGRSPRQSVEVYNYASSYQNPLTYGRYEELLSKYDDVFTTGQSVWYRSVLLTKSEAVASVLYYAQLPLMYILDCLKPRRNLITMYKKMHRLNDISKYFSNRSWCFKNTNTQDLWTKLDDDDRTKFNFDLASLDWDSVMSAFSRGILLYTLQEEPLEYVPKAQARKRTLKFLHYGSLLMLLFIATCLLSFICRLF